MLVIYTDILIFQATGNALPIGSLASKYPSIDKITCSASPWGA